MLRPAGVAEVRHTPRVVLRRRYCHDAPGVTVHRGAHVAAAGPSGAAAAVVVEPVLVRPVAATLEAACWTVPPAACSSGAALEA